MNTTAGFVGDATNKPIFAVAILAGDDIIFADFAGKWYSTREVGGNLTNKIKFFRKTIFVDERAVGGHLHTRINSDEIGELTR